MLGGDEEVGRRVGIRLAGLEHDLGAGHDGGVGVGSGEGNEDLYCKLEMIPITVNAVRSPHRKWGETRQQLDLVSLWSAAV